MGRKTRNQMYETSTYSKKETGTINNNTHREQISKYNFYREIESFDSFYKLFEEFTEIPTFYHLNKLGPLFLRRTIKTGIRPHQHMFLFRDVMEQSYRHGRIYDNVLDEPREYELSALGSIIDYINGERYGKITEEMILDYYKILI